jgi:hypothetical protein
MRREFCAQLAHAASLRVAGAAADSSHRPMDSGLGGLIFTLARETREAEAALISGVRRELFSASITVFRKAAGSRLSLLERFMLGWLDSSKCAAVNLRTQG